LEYVFLFNPLSQLFSDFDLGEFCFICGGTMLRGVVLRGINGAVCAGMSAPKAITGIKRLSFPFNFLLTFTHCRGSMPWNRWSIMQRNRDLASKAVAGPRLVYKSGLRVRAGAFKG
jgi:hypothetical protein